MIIGIDGNEANEAREDIGERVGVNQYAFEMLWALYSLTLKERKKHNFIIYLKNYPKKDFPRENSYWKYKVIPGKGLWIITKFMPHLINSSQKPDVLFAPSHYLPLFSPIPMVCTIHDLGYLKFSGQFKKYDFWQLKYWSAMSIYISKYIISVSQSTKNDIVRHYHCNPKKIIVTYHGFDKLRFNTEISKNVVRRVRKKFNIPKNYILFLSTLKPSKNIEGLLESYKILKSKEDDVAKLVIAGKKGWMFESIFEKVKSLHLSNDVVFTDFVSEEDKPGLYSGAKILVSPSHWEGFGMHVLEAMACGTPVVISNVASLPEVAGQAGIYVDPNDSENIAKAMKKVLEMTTKRYNKLVENSVAQAKTFSWEKAAKKVLETLERTK